MKGLAFCSRSGGVIILDAADYIKLISEGYTIANSSGYGKALKRENTHIGAFENEIDAAIAYDNFATDKFGDFALTNKMLGRLNNV